MSILTSAKLIRECGINLERLRISGNFEMTSLYGGNDKILLSVCNFKNNNYLTEILASRFYTI